MVRKLIFILSIICLSLPSFGAHLVGGDLTFQCIGNNRYTFNLKVYRDAGATAAHDNPAYIFIYNNDNNALFATRSATPGSISNVANNDLGPCLQNPAPPSFDFATYNFANIELPPNTSGYRVVYQRCCRTNDAQNLVPNFDGISQGSTYEVRITPKVMQECNGSAATIPVFEFASSPPTQLCANEIVLVDQSVLGGILAFVDSVTYSLCPPFEGGSGTNCIIPNPTIVGSTCTTPDGQCDAPCPYSVVSYAPGYTFQTPMGPTSTVDIDFNTGQMAVEPSATGIYVVGICATAYKDGEIWTFNRRDFQFKVFDCIADEASPPIAINGSNQDLDSVSIEGVDIESVYLVCNSDLTVSFNQSSTQAINYFWDFGDSSTLADTSSLAFPFYSYPDTGVYVVTLVVNANLPCVDTAWGAVRVYPDFTTSFVFDDGCLTLPVEFTDSSFSELSSNQITEWQWDFGDGSPISNEQNPNHLYGTADDFDVTLTAITEIGCFNSFTTTITTEPAPVADFDNLLACTGTPHQFNNLSSLNGTALDSYVWDFGDGAGLSFTTTSVQPPLQTYTTAGDYTVRVVINSLSGCSDTITKVLSVGETVAADFNFAPTPVCPGQNIEFTNTTTQSFDSFEWTIDGNAVTDISPNYTFTAPGQQPVTLIILSNMICGDTITKNVLVEDGPFADFVVDSSCTMASFTFENLSLDNGFPIDDYIWDFGDGNNGTGFSPTHEYLAVGDFDVTLIVSSDLVVCSDTVVKVMNIKEGITADFTYLPDTICEDRTIVNFTNETSGGNWDAVEWDLGLDTLFITDNPSAIYAEPGNYNVTLSIFDDICGETKITKALNVLVVPEPNLPDMANVCDGIIFPLTVANNFGYDIQWSTGQTSTSINIDNTLDTIIVVVNNQGCIAADTTFVTRDCPAYLPNTFTPDGDGVNDSFLPLPFNITSFSLRIYDRWGEMVFETSSFNRGWSGSFNDGTNAPMDTYSYIFEGIGLDEKPLFQHGIVNLIR